LNILRRAPELRRTTNKKKKKINTGRGPSAGHHRRGPPHWSSTALVLHRTKPPPCRARTGHRGEGAGRQGRVLPRRERRGGPPDPRAPLDWCLSDAEPHGVVIAVGLEIGREFLVHELFRRLDLRTREREQDGRVPGDIPTDGDPVKRRAHSVVCPRLHTRTKNSSMKTEVLPVVHTKKT
jgi:hypothetical protein